MRWRLLVCLVITWAAVAASAQTWPPIPLIPSQERFEERSDLAITLHLQATELMVGEPLAFTLRLRNTGRRTLRVPPDASANSNVQLRVFDASGGEIRPAETCNSRSLGVLTSVRTYVRIKSAHEHALALGTDCGLPPLPVGHYSFEATYWNHPDVLRAYDVYERGAAEVWEGRVTTPRLQLAVVTLDATTAQSLMARVDSSMPVAVIGDAIQRLSLDGSAAAISALRRRFERDSSSRPGIVAALAQNPSLDAAAAIAEAVGGLPPPERSLLRPSHPSERRWIAAGPPATVLPEYPFPGEVRPDPAAAPDYLRQLIDGDGNDDTRELALKGVARFGTVDDVLEMKRAFDNRDEARRGNLVKPLSWTTFASDRDAVMLAEPSFWNSWFRTHSRRTRAEWAREALQRGILRTKQGTQDRAPSRAADFLLATQGLSPRLVLELTQHQSWLVRLVAADAVAEADRQSGGRLFIRELSNRSVDACMNANDRLETLVHRRRPIDCVDPGQRRAAIAHWTEVVNRLGPGFLPLTVAASPQ